MHSKLVAPAIKLPTPRSRYFLTAGCIALAVVLGFWKTFILPSFEGTFTAPSIIYVHGVFLFAWTVFLVFQSVLIQRRNLKLHRKIGWVGPALMLGVTISTMSTGVYVLQRDVASQGPIAKSSFLGTLFTPIIFVILVTAGIIYRRRPEIHKRLMLLAMISIIWAAFGRFRHYFPPFEQSLLVFQGIVPTSMVFVVMLWEKFTKGRIHPVYLIAGLPLVIESCAEIYFFDSSGWQIVSAWVASFFL
ncbi:MAG: hypothetical protein ABI481_11040 [Pyrinomonadaceae bacterium]